MFTKLFDREGLANEKVCFISYMRTFFADSRAVTDPYHLNFEYFLKFCKRGEYFTRRIVVFMLCINYRSKKHDNLKRWVTGGVVRGGVESRGTKEGEEGEWLG